MKAKLDLNWANIKRLSTAQVKATRATAEQLLHEAVTEQVIPLDTGNLQNVATYLETKDMFDGKVTIVTEAPYAKRLYYHPEYKFDKTFNTNAQGEWWEPWITGNKSDRPKRIFGVMLRKFSGGVIK